MKLYLKMYLRFATDGIKKFDHMSEMKVLLAILEDCQKDTLQWTSFRHKRQEIAMKIGVGEITVNRAITMLVKKGFLERTARGVYRINKNYFDFG